MKWDMKAIFSHCARISFVHDHNVIMMLKIEIYIFAESFFRVTNKRVIRNPSRIISMKQLCGTEILCGFHNLRQFDAILCSAAQSSGAIQNNHLLSRWKWENDLTRLTRLIGTIWNKLSQPFTYHCFGCFSLDNFNPISCVSQRTAKWAK